MKTFFTLFITFFPCTALAQVPQPAMLWLKGYGGVGGGCAINSAITPATDGGFILSIGTNSYSGPITDSFCSIYTNRNIFIKYNADASVLEWNKCYDDDWTDTGFVYMFEISGGYILGGESGYGTRWLIHKEDSVGNIIWSKSYGGSSTQILTSMITTNDGGYIMFGESYSDDGDVGFHYGSSTNADFWLLKLDSIGNKIWSKVIGGTGNQVAASVVNAPDGGCYIFGATTSNDYDCTGNHGGADAYLAMLDSNGNILWHNDLGGSNDDGGATYAIEDGKGGIIATTVSASDDGDVSHHINNPGGENIWNMEIDSNNNILWNNCYGGGWDEFPNSVCKAIDGSIWIAANSMNKGGEVDTAYGNGDAWFVHTDSVGNFLSAIVLGSSGQDVAYMIYPLSNGSAIAGGYYSQNNGDFSELDFYGSFPATDAFLTVFAPWTTNVSNISYPSNLIKIYPNPADIQVTIETEQNGNYDLLVTDAIGSIICNGRFIDKVQISVSDWKPGLYSVEVIDQNGYKNVQKLIIERVY